MIYFTLSAPSKLSLCGEYAVKYGKKGLTAGIDLRTTLTFTELSHLKLSIIHINFLQINILLSIPLMRFLAFYRSCTFNEDNNELREQVLQFITSNRCSFRTEHQRAITQSFIYLLAYISHKEEIDITSFSVHLSTQLMIDGNFVCLASFTVCVAAALLRWSRLQKGAFDNFDTNDLRKIHSYAARCEQITHECGTANVAACTYGSIMLYQTGKILHYIPFFDIMNVKILLVDSKQELNLEARTQRVVELMNKDPETAHYIFACIDGAINVATHALQNLAPTYTNAELDLESKRLILMMQHNILLTFINLNQRLLNLLDVSHFHLEKICSIAISREYYAKCTDIGNGRCAYIWCLPNKSFRSISGLCEELKTNGFDVKETTLACRGVRLEH